MNAPEVQPAWTWHPDEDADRHHPPRTLTSQGEMLLTWSWNTDGRHFSLHLAGMSTDDRFSTETEAREFVEQHYRPGDPDLDLPGDRDDRPRPPLTLISSALRAHQKMVVVIESVIEDSRGVRYALCGTSFSSEMHPQSCSPEAHRRR